MTDGPARLWTIGEFSKATGITIKALRFYHERKLLIPARVEAGSGYRFYNERSLETAQIIQSLRELEFSVDAIQSLLNEQPNEGTALNYLQERRQQVLAKVAEQRRILKRLDQIIAREQENRRTWDEADVSIEQKELKPMLIAGIRMSGRYEDMGQGFSRLGRAAGRHIAGPGMCLYYDDEYREEDADFEPFFPIKRNIDTEGVSVRKLSGGTAVCIRHTGPYPSIRRSYARLFAFAKTHGLERTVPSREVYLKGPGMLFKGNPNKYVTEIQLLIVDNE